MSKIYVTTIDEEFEKSRVKGFVRTRKGRMERVKEFERRGGGAGAVQKIGKHKNAISDKRIQTHLAALPEFNFKTVEVRNLGLWEDKPQLEFTGTYQGKEIKYRTQSPGGGMSSVRVKTGKGLGRKAHEKRRSIWGGTVKIQEEPAGWQKIHNTSLSEKSKWMKKLDKLLAENEIPKKSPNWKRRIRNLYR